MTMQPILGEALLAGRVDGQKVGQAIFQALPCIPFLEGPPGMPRFIAKAIFPAGLIPGRLPAAQPPVAPLIPAAVQPPRAAAPAAPSRPPAPPPRRRVLERGTFPEWH